MICELIINVFIFVFGIIIGAMFTEGPDDEDPNDHGYDDFYEY